MHRFLLSLFIGLPLGLFSFAAQAQDALGEAEDPAVDPLYVVAEVNGVPIVYAQIDLLYAAFEGQLQGTPMALVFGELLDIAIQTEVIAQQAEASGLAESDAFAQRLAFLRANILEQEYITAELDARLTEERLQEQYQAYVAAFIAEEEVSARHILVASEAEALDVIARLDAGEDFAELASTLSLDPGSGSRGGDLGFFGRGMMVPPFEEAAFTQEVGVHSSSPIESQFGFHIILVETRRDSEPLDFETQRPQLIRAAESDIIQAIRSEATDAAEITLSANPFTEAEGEASEAEDSSAD